MRLQRRLRTIRERSRARTDPATNTVLDRITADLKARGAEFAALRPGMMAPDFALPDQIGRMVSLFDRLAAGPVVLVFYRGEWCPYCCAQLRALQVHLPAIRGAGANLVAVSPEDPDRSLTLPERNALDYAVLTDRGFAVARRYGLVYRVPDALRAIYLQAGLDLGARNGQAPGEPWELPIPATFIVAPTGAILYARVDPDVTQRPEPQTVVDILLAREAAR